MNTIENILQGLFHNAIVSEIFAIEQRFDLTRAWVAMRT